MSEFGYEDSQAERAYGALRALIRESTYAPGSVLSENALAERLRIGRTPIRDAVVRLVHEGLLVRLPKRGVLINTMSAEDVRELYEVREALEVMCVRQAAANMDEHKFGELQEQVVDAARAVDDGIDLVKYHELDRRFHACLASSGSNQRAYRLLDSMFDAAILDPWVGKICAIPGQLRRSVDEHTAIVDALGSGDPDEAESAVRAHACSYRRALAQHLFGAV